LGIDGIKKLAGAVLGLIVALRKLAKFLDVQS
jgi:hypothetical protein